jgi:hypothetical protein
MKKVQFFSDINITSLQIQVNEWLAVNKNISVIETNLVTVVIDKIEQFSFYILYNVIGHRARKTAIISEELKQPFKSENIQALGLGLAGQ